MEPKGSLPHSQEPASCPYPEPYQCLLLASFKIINKICIPTALPFNFEVYVTIFFCGEGPRCRLYGGTAAFRLIVQHCYEDND
jgi:hypothetical protein